MHTGVTGTRSPVHRDGSSSGRELSPLTREAATPRAAPLAQTLEEIADRFPPTPDHKHYFTLRNRRNWAQRTAYDIALVTDRVGTSGRICDVGGGYGLFAIGCATLGMEVTLIEDFGDIERVGHLERTLELMDEYGVVVKRRDIIADGLDLEPEQFDAATLFHVMEHLPFSPKPLFSEMMAALRPGGVFAIAGPNAVNLRKRISVPLGTASWTPIVDWYEGDPFRGHVREPTVPDFRYIANDLKLERTAISGRNFLGRASVKPGRRQIAAVVDRAITPFPSLCSDLYLVGEKRR
jgi:SAM-dependent methyltransferase